MDHYLRLWSPGAWLKLGAELEPVEINRERKLLGVESAAFSALSFGAREQPIAVNHCRHIRVKNLASRILFGRLDGTGCARPGLPG